MYKKLCEHIDFSYAHFRGFFQFIFSRAGCAVQNQRHLDDRLDFLKSVVINLGCLFVSAVSRSDGNRKRVYAGGLCIAACNLRVSQHVLCP